MYLALEFFMVNKISIYGSGKDGNEVRSVISIPEGIWLSGSGKEDALTLE